MNYTIICQDNVASDGFMHSESSKKRAIKYAREFCAESVQDMAQATVVIYKTRPNGSVVLFRSIYKCVNSNGRAISRSVQS